MDSRRLACLHLLYRAAQRALLMIDLTSKLNRVGNRVQASLPDARPFLSSPNARLACISGRNYS